MRYRIFSPNSKPRFEVEEPLELGQMYQFPSRLISTIWNCKTAQLETTVISSLSHLERTLRVGTNVWINTKWSNFCQSSLKEFQLGLRFESRQKYWIFVLARNQNSCWDNRSIRNKVIEFSVPTRAPLYFFRQINLYHQKSFILSWIWPPFVRYKY